MTFLPTNNGGLLGYRPSQTAALSGLLGYDGKTAARKSLGAALMMAGAKIASANPGNIVGPAILGLAEGANYGEDSYRKSVRDQFEMSQLQREAEQQQRQDAFANRVGGLLGNGGAGEPLPYNAGMTRQTGAASPAAGASGSGASLGSFSDPALLPDFLAAYPDQAGSIYADMLKPKDPLRVTPGTTLLNPDDYSTIYSAPDNRAPTTRTVYDNGLAVQQEWDAAKGKWVEVGSGPRWSTSEAGGITAAQAANNAEIDAARRSLAALGNLTPDLIRRKTTRVDPNDPFGMKANPDFDPQFARLLMAASQRKVGADPDFEKTWGRIYGAGEPAPTAAPGGDVPAVQGNNPTPPAEDGSLSAVPLPLDPRGQIDTGQLTVGSLYDSGDGVYRWTGFGFEPVQ